MSFSNRFDETEKIYQDVCHKVANPQNFFFTSTYASLHRMTFEVSLTVDSLLTALVDVLMDENISDDFKNVHSYMCYTKKYLKEKAPLDKKKYTLIRNLLDTTLRLGLMTHLFLVLSPSREDWYKELDLVHIRKEWSQRMLRVEKIINRYNNDVKKLPCKMFEGYYKHYVEPVLREDLSIQGVLKMKRQYDFFRKLFFCGVLLGLESDYGTRIAKAKAEDSSNSD